MSQSSVHWRDVVTLSQNVLHNTMISYIPQRNDPQFCYTVIVIVIFLGHFCPRWKGAWGYPYVKHQPTRRHNTKDSYNTGNFAPHCDITVPDLVVGMKVVLSAERRSLRISVVAWKSPWVKFFDRSPPEVTGCHLLVLLALWVLVMLRNGLEMNEPWGTLAPTRQVDSLTVSTIHIFGCEILVSQSR